jgi:hypothetical protein
VVGTRFRVSGGKRPDDLFPSVESLKSKNRLRMSQVFYVSAHLSSGGFAFQER